MDEHYLDDPTVYVHPKPIEENPVPDGPVLVQGMAQEGGTPVPDHEKEPPKNTRNSSSFLYLSIILVILVAAAGYFLLSTNGSSPLSTPNIYLDPNLASLVTLAPPLPSYLSSSLGSLSLLAVNSSEPAAAAALGNSSSSRAGGSPITSSQLSGIWDGYNPTVRCEALATLYSLGAIPDNAMALKALNATPPSGGTTQSAIQSFCASYQNRLTGVFPGIPLVTPNKVSIYELASTAQYVSASASELGYLFGCDLMGGTNQAEGPAGNYAPISLSQSSASYTLTTANPGDASSPYGQVMVSMSTNWLGLISSLPNPANYTELANGAAMNCKSGSTNTNQFFYSLSLLQYFSVQFYENLYNRTVQPDIAFISYNDNTLVVNAGDIPPQKSATLLSVDGNAVNYVQHYNFFVADLPLQPGNHTVSLKSGSAYNLHKRLYVNPPLYLSSVVNSGSLSATLGTSSSSNIIVSSITLDRVSFIPSNGLVQTSLVNASLTGAPSTISKSGLKSFSTSLSGFCGVIGTPLELAYTVHTNLGTAQYLGVTRCS